MSAWRRRLSVGHPAWNYIARSTLILAVLLLVAGGEGRPSGSPAVSPWYFVVPLIVVTNIGGHRARGRGQFSYDCTPAVSYPMVLCQSPMAVVLLTVGCHAIRGAMTNKGLVKTAYNATWNAASLLVLSVVLHAALDGTDLLGARGVLAFSVAVMANDLVSLVTLEPFIRRLAADLGHPVEGRLIQLGLLLEMAQGIAIGVAAIAGLRAARGDSALWWLVPFMAVLAVALLMLANARMEHRGTLDAERAWLAAIRSPGATEDLELLAHRLIDTLGGEGIRLEIGSRVAEVGELPAAGLAKLIARDRDPAPTFASVDVNLLWQLSGRSDASVAQVPLAAGAEPGYLVLSYRTRMLSTAFKSLAGRLAEVADEVALALEREKDQAQLDWAARHDQLTEMLQPAAFVRALDAALAEWDGATVLLANVGGLREVNDLFGREAGDGVLRDLARRLQDALPGRALTARLGGHLFACAFEGHDADRAEDVAGLLYGVLRRPVDSFGPGLDVRLSLGIARSPDHGSVAADLLRRAELALDSADATSAPTATFAWDAEREAQRRLRLVPDLRVALRDGEIRAAYQPQLTPREGRVVGVEALARWIHPELGFIPPDEFVRLAESSGLVRELTLAILGQALRQYLQWEGLGFVVPVSVNLSARSLGEAHLVEDVVRLLRETGVPARHLTLEVTETAMIEQPNRAIASLQQLRTLGAKVSLDDFGTGHSSLAYLKTLPADEVKLDRAFTCDLGDPRAVSLVRASLQLAHALGLVMVAEGVEDEPALDTLRELGVDVAQGYHLCRPAAPEVITAWLVDRAGAAPQPRAPLSASRQTEPAAG